MVLDARNLIIGTFGLDLEPDFESLKNIGPEMLHITIPTNGK